MPNPQKALTPGSLEQEMDQFDLKTFFKAFFDSRFEGIAITDIEGNLVKINDTFSVITGYEEDEVIGKNTRILKSDRHDDDFYRLLWEKLLGSHGWEGEIWNRHKNGEIYPEWLRIRAILDKKGNRRGYLASFFDLSKRRNLEEKLNKYAFFDVLTGLPNKDQFMGHLAKELKQGDFFHNKVALLCLNIDRFKNVNDNFGHISGDKIIQEVADRLSEVIRKNDTVSRFSGDNFYIIMSGRKDVRDVLRDLENLEGAFSEPFSSNDSSFFLSCTKGIAVFPEDACDAHSLLLKGEMALHRARESRRGTYVFFSSKIEKKVKNKLKIESAIRRALIKDQFCPFFQPQVDLSTGRITGMEALARWMHPARGIVPPCDFIPIAEETGLIGDIDIKIMEKACTWIRKTKDSMGFAVPVSVNLSPRSLFNGNLIGNITEILDRTGVLPSDLCLEITETVAMENVEKSMELFEKIHKMGIPLHLDDFGTGYSSLNYLQRLTVDCLKIDRSFIDDMTCSSGNFHIVKSVIALGHALGLKVLAEGAETEEHVNMLKEINCDMVQGFYYWRPMPGEEAAKCLMDNS